MAERTLLIDVDSWGGCACYLVSGRTKLYLCTFRSTMPSFDYLRSAKRWERTFKRLTGIEHVKVVKHGGIYGKAEADG